ncbi:MAG: TRAP transporter large permease subunit, partial [Rhodospirillales bacterium]|nr:TRAP transporter large permease subunit [Rhodospirillales bacterium]
YSVMENDTLVAIPLFLFMGYVVERANIVNRLFSALQMAARNLPGSMAIAALITCAVFSTASGIVGAVVTLMGLLAYPAMMKANYDKEFASGVICAGGTLGILIPPSIMLIVYAAIAELSPLRLYAAAVIPGFMLAGMYMLYVVGRVLINPSIAPKPREEDIPPKKQIYWQLLTSFVPLTLLIMLVLGSILGGLATPGEAAAMGALGAIVLATVYRSLNWTMLKQSVYLTAKTTAMVCWLFVGSWTFASVFSYLGGHEVIEMWVLSFDLAPWQFLIMVQLIIFLLGWPLEWSEILIIFVPIFLPMLDNFGVNPYFFAMLVALNLQTSFLTPPMAMSAYYLKGVLGLAIELMEIFRGLMPYLAIVILCMVLMYQFPGIALWLPDVLFGVYVP